MSSIHKQLRAARLQMRGQGRPSVIGSSPSSDALSQPMMRWAERDRERRAFAVPDAPGKESHRS
jgi:hypothetical protein